MNVTYMLAGLSVANKSSERTVKWRHTLRSRVLFFIIREKPLFLRTKHNSVNVRKNFGVKNNRACSFELQEICRFFFQGYVGMGLRYKRSRTSAIAGTHFCLNDGIHRYCVLKKQTNIYLILNKNIILLEIVKYDLK